MKGTWLKFNFEENLFFLWTTQMTWKLISDVSDYLKTRLMFFDETRKTIWSNDFIKLKNTQNISELIKAKIRI